MTASEMEEIQVRGLKAPLKAHYQATALGKALGRFKCREFSTVGLVAVSADRKLFAWHDPTRGTRVEEAESGTLILSAPLFSERCAVPLRNFSHLLAQGVLLGHISQGEEHMSRIVSFHSDSEDVTLLPLHRSHTALDSCAIRNVLEPDLVFGSFVSFFAHAHVQSSACFWQFREDAWQLQMAPKFIQDLGCPLAKSRDSFLAIEPNAQRGSEDESEIVEIQADTVRRTGIKLPGYDITLSGCGGSIVFGTIRDEDCDPGIAGPISWFFADTNSPTAYKRLPERFSLSCISPNGTVLAGINSICGAFIIERNSGGYSLSLVDADGLETKSIAAVDDNGTLYVTAQDTKNKSSYLMPLKLTRR